jgi:hypothetical protein
MKPRDFSEIDAKVQESLQDTAFEASNLDRLSGGSVNWIYAASLLQPLEDGTMEVVVKHGETHMASKPDMELNLLRCVSLLLSFSLL